MFLFLFSSRLGVPAVDVVRLRGLHADPLVPAARAGAEGDQGQLRTLLRRRLQR